MGEHAKIRTALLPYIVYGVGDAERRLQSRATALNKLRMHNLGHTDDGYAYVTQRFLLKRFVAFEAGLALASIFRVTGMLA